MLRTILPCIILCIFAVVVNGQTPADNTKILEYFRQKCFQNGRSEQVFNKLNADTTEFANYFNHISTLIPNGMDVFCNRERSQISARINDVANDLKPCLSQQEQFLAGFMNTSFNEFIHFLCHKDAKYTKRFFSPEAEQCRNALFNSQESGINSCFNRIFPPRSHAVTKQEVCSNIGIAKECIRRSVSELCPNDRNYQELHQKLFQYISTPCSGCFYYVNTLLLMMSLILSYIFSR